MDYVEMIRDPELVLGFRELVSDSEPVVVKRTVKVFTSVYYHTLRLLASGELEEETLMKSWHSIKSVVDSLLSMVKRCDNEGVLVHLVRFLESAVMSHLVYDLTSYPIVFERGREVIKTGLKALKDLVTTPYVGGSTFIVGVRSLINIACVRQDLWEPVTDLLKKQLSSLPPTLFDHNVRSLHKALQKNLFRLLRRADNSVLKGKLIEMMVSVGVPRKLVAPWAPANLENRKRSPPSSFNEDMVLGRVTPPEKKLRADPENDEGIERPRSITPEAPSDPRRRILLEDPRLVNGDEPVTNTMEKCPPEVKMNNSDLLFLTSLIPTGKKEDKAEELSRFAKEIYEKLDLEKVCRLVIRNVDDVPDIEPKDFVPSFKSHGSPHESVETLRNRLSSMLGDYLTKYGVESLDSETSASTKPQTENSPVELSSSTKQFNVRSNSSSSSSTPSSTPPLGDTDMRQVYRPSNSSRGDVDMRIADPRLAARDPRLQKDPRSRKEVADPRIAPIESKAPRVDPRLEKTADPQTREDPRLSTNSSTRSEPRKTRWDPRTPPVEPNNVSGGSVNAGSQHTRPQVPNNDISNRLNDPRTSRPQSRGLLPHPDPRTFNKDAMDPRIHLQNQTHDPRIPPQNFMNQVPFSFGHIPQGVSNPFMGNVNIPPQNAGGGPMPMFNGAPYGWQPNGNNPPGPSFLLAPVQQGILPPRLLNL